MIESVLTSTFLKIRDRLRSLATGIVGDAEDAEDILHDAFCKLWINHKGIQSELDASKLSYTTVRNTAIDSFRRNRAHSWTSIDYNMEPADRLDSNEENEERAVCDALLRLSRKILNDRQYQIFMMHDVEGMPYPEIAHKLSISQENVRTILSRARKSIREEYRRKNF